MIGSAKSRPEYCAEVRSLALEHVRRSRAEPGCIDHQVSIDCEDDLRFVFVEHWQDTDALEAHFALASSREFVRQISSMLSEPPKMAIYASEEIKPG
ncbi:MAG: putative quinol monooxygenase [Parasphingopyxis sp.]